MSDTIILTTPEQIEMARVLTLRSALKLQVAGLRMSRGQSALAIARKSGLTTKRTAQGALDDLNELLAQHGF